MVRYMRYVRTNKEKDKEHEDHDKARYVRKCPLRPRSKESSHSEYSTTEIS
jgi:hypothetical protein